MVLSAIWASKIIWLTSSQSQKLLSSLKNTSIVQRIWQISIIITNDSPVSVVIDTPVFHCLPFGWKNLYRNSIINLQSLHVMQLQFPAPINFAKLVFDLAIRDFLTKVIEPCFRNFIHACQMNNLFFHSPDCLNQWFTSEPTVYKYIIYLDTLRYGSPEPVQCTLYLGIICFFSSIPGVGAIFSSLVMLVAILFFQSIWLFFITASFPIQGEIKRNKLCLVPATHH